MNNPRIRVNLLQLEIPRSGSLLFWMVNNPRMGSNYYNRSRGAVDTSWASVINPRIGLNYYNHEVRISRSVQGQ